MHDVLIVGAGPAGSIAGLVLARAGVRVRIVDRASFPRDKLCGDTINPGTLARLRALGVADEIDACALPIDGMLVTSARAAVVGRYPRGVSGRALRRRDLDWILLRCAIRAGCAFDPDVLATRPIVDGSRVTGVHLRGKAGECRLAARVTIAADGRRSAIAWRLGAARHPVRPRRWAIGAYVTGVGEWASSGVGDPVGRQLTDSPALGEMHVRRHGYIGVAAVARGLTNVCIVRPSAPADEVMRDPVSLLRRMTRADPFLAARFADAVLVTRPVVLGPLAVDTTAPPLDGLLLAGDAAGFIDPMTGDGLRFAVRGGELAADAALDALAHGWTGVHARLDARRRAEFTGKQRFNRALRALVARPRLVDAVAAASRLAPAVLQRVIARAGDVHECR
jgi:flavin-dependent dehydrogenase